MSRELFDALDAYAVKFDDVPTTIGLPDSKWDAAAKAIRQAVDDGDPFADDAAFYAAIGMDPLPDDALI